MEYVQDVLDRNTGDLVRVSLGNWITITELGAEHGASNRQTRSILRQMGFLVVDGTGKNARHRLAEWVTDRGWGKRLRPAGKQPFDVVGPDAQQWVAERWASALDTINDLSPPARQARDHLAAFKERRPDVAASIQAQLTWLSDHYPDISQAEKGKIVDVSQQLVSRFDAARSARINHLVALRQTLGSPTGFPITRHLSVSRHITQGHNTSRKRPLPTAPLYPIAGEYLA